MAELAVGVTNGRSAVSTFLDIISASIVDLRGKFGATTPERPPVSDLFRGSVWDRQSGLGVAASRHFA
jgi:hypothetical protein